MKKGINWKVVGLSFGLFLFFLILKFPYRNFKGYVFGKIFTASGIRINAQDFHPTFLGWPGVVLEKAEIELPTGRSALLISAEEIVARVGLGFFPPGISYRITAQNLQQGGTIYASYQDGSTATNVYAVLNEVNLQGFPIPGMADTITGTANGTANLSIDKTDLSKTTGEIDLALKGLKIPPQNLQGFVLPQFPFGDSRAKIRIQNGVMEIQQFQLGQPASDFSGTLSGDARLGKTLMDTHLKLTLKIHLSEPYRKNPQATNVVGLLESFRINDQGDYGLGWSAKIYDMTTNLMSAIPQKVSN